jgi:type I restriction enzyme, S subunit
MKAGWTTWRLEELVEIRLGRTPPRAEKKFWDPIKATDNTWVSIADLSENEGGIITESKEHLSKAGADSTPLVKAGTLLVSFKLSLGKVAIAGKDLRTNEAIAAMPIKVTELDVNWLKYFFQFFDWDKAAVGEEKVKGKALNKEKLKEIEIPLPPVAEQKRIVALLDEAFAGIEEAKAKAEEGLSLSKKLFESSLNGMFEVKDGAWVDTQLSDVLAKQPQNGWSPPAANHSSEGTPVLTLSSVTGFAFRPNKIKHTSAKVERSKNYWVENGDLLITRSNTPELVGHVAIAEGITTPTIYPDLIMRMNPKSGHATTEFLYYQLRTSKLRNEITGRAQGANPTMKKISNSAVKTLPVSIPSVKIQIEISAKLKETEQVSDKLRSVCLKKIGALLELKSSILAKAFAGELTA